MDFAQGGGDHFDFGVFFADAFHHGEEGGGIELGGGGGDFGAGKAEAELEVLLVADEDIDQVDDPAQYFRRLRSRGAP